MPRRSLKDMRLTKEFDELFMSLLYKPEKQEILYRCVEKYFKKKIGKRMYKNYRSYLNSRTYRHSKSKQLKINKGMNKRSVATSRDSASARRASD